MKFESTVLLLVIKPVNTSILQLVELLISWFGFKFNKVLLYVAARRRHMFVFIKNIIVYKGVDLQVSFWPDYLIPLFIS